MKTITRSKIYLPMAAMILTAALAAPAAARQVPFVGAMQGDDVDAVLSPPQYWSLPPARELEPISVNSQSPEKYCKPRGRHFNRVGSLDRGQWRQHRYDNCRIG